MTPKERENGHVPRGRLSAAGGDFAQLIGPPASPAGNICHSYLQPEKDFCRVFTLCCGRMHWPADSDPARSSSSWLLFGSRSLASLCRRERPIFVRLEKKARTRRRLNRCSAATRSRRVRPCLQDVTLSSDPIGLLGTILMEWALRRSVGFSQANKSLSVGHNAASALVGFPVLAQGLPPSCVRRRMPGSTSTRRCRMAVLLCRRLERLSRGKSTS